MSGDLNSEMNAARMPIVRMKDGEARADSRDVAAFFDKRHDHVLRDIRALIAKEPRLGLSNFGETPFIEPSTGQTYHYFEMDRRGFTVLAMGFTGGRALEWKLRYIDAFELMEDELRRRPQAIINYSDPTVIIGVYKALESQIAAKDQKIAVQQTQIVEMQPKVEAHDRIAESHGTFNRTVAAKMLGITPHTLIRWMRTNQWTYRRPGSADDIAYQDKISSGYLEHKIATGQRGDGTTWASTHVYVTPRGLAALAKHFPSGGGVPDRHGAWGQSGGVQAA